ncbi:F-box and wd40 domain protein, partial [Reticulomyxa filosa]
MRQVNKEIMDVICKNISFCVYLIKYCIFNHINVAKILFTMVYTTNCRIPRVVLSSKEILINSSKTTKHYVQILYKFLKNFLSSSKKQLYVPLKSYFTLPKIFFKTPFITFKKKSSIHFTSKIILSMITLTNEKQTSTQIALVRFITSFQKSEEKKIQVIVQHWIRISNIKLGWIKDFDKLIINYIYAVFMFETFRSSSKLINTFTGHTSYVWSIDYSICDNCQLICSGSNDKTVRVWDVDNNKQIQSFNGHSSNVYCVKFSSYYYHNNRQHVICSSSFDKTIRFWDFKHNKELQIFNGHTSY